MSSRVANRVCRTAAVIAVCFLAACGGGGGASMPAPSTPGPSPSGRIVSVAIAVTVPSIIGSRAASTNRRAPRYVSPATTTIQISVNGGPPQTFALGSGAACSAGASTVSQTCAVYVVNAPVGSDTFAVTLLDSANHVLSAGTATATIVADTTNTVNITFDGVIASLRVSLANASPPVGNAATIPVSLFPLDAAQYTVVGAPGALPSIAVSDDDTSGTTGLYLAGSDGTCSTQSAPPAASVTTVPSGGQYHQVCLNYTGAALANGATITATIAGGPSGTTKMIPSQPQAAASGFWLLGTTTTNGQPTLERVDTNLSATLAISGSQTMLLTNVLSAMTADSTGNVEILAGNTIDTYSGTNGGNVPPLSITTFQTPAAVLSVLAVDKAGNAYVVAANSGYCTIFRVPLINGPASATAVGDCFNVEPAFFTVSGMGFDAQGRLYVSIPRGAWPKNPQGMSIFRYARNTDGSFTPDSAITPTSGFGANVNFDPSGNLVVVGGLGYPEKYAAAAFVPGQNASVSPIDTYPAAGVDYSMAVDPSGNIAVQYSAASPDWHVALIPSGSHAVAHTIPFTVTAMAGATSAAPGPSGSLSVTPTSVEIPAQSNIVTLTENGYTGPFTETDSCSGVVTVQPATGTGPAATFTLVQGHSGGKCAVTFADAGSVHTATVQVGVTATIITGQGRRRRP
jgi:hypothetical protein